MQLQPLMVLAIEAEAVPLRVLKEALRRAGYPAEIGVGIAGAATEEELNSREWEAAFVRWLEPQVHEAALLDRSVVGKEPEADEILAELRRLVEASDDQGGRLIVSDHLAKTRALYAWQLLPALLEDDDHPAWEALDVALRSLAENTDGLIYAEAEGFYDADGESPLLVMEAPEEDEETP